MKAKYIIITGFVLLAVTVLVAFGAGMAQAQDQPPAPVPTGPGVPYLDGMGKRSACRCRGRSLHPLG